MDSMVTIIIPTYKGEEYLGRALRTVLNQSYTSFEIIVVDDNGMGSFHQVQTEKVIKEINDNRINYIIHEKNMNGAVARNTGLKKAKGKYITFLDDDDLMLKDRIKNAVNFLESNKEYNAVFSNVACCDENLNITRIVEVNKSGNCMNDILLDDMFFGTGSNIFITRKAFEKNGYFDEKFLRHQDLEYMIRFFRNFKSGITCNIDIIKSKNGINNIPKYEKLFKNEELYNVTFKKEIEHLSTEDKKTFYKNQNLMLNVSKICSSKISVENIKIFINLPMTYKFLVLITKMGIEKLKWFKKINSRNKNRKYRKMKSELPEYLINFVDNYKEEL